MRINQHVAKELGIPDDKVVHNIERYGNTTAATIPIGLSEAFRDGRIEKGSTVLFAAFGAGFTWGASVVRFLGSRGSRSGRTRANTWPSSVFDFQLDLARRAGGFRPIGAANPERAVVGDPQSQHFAPLDHDGAPHEGVESREIAYHVAAVPTGQASPSAPRRLAASRRRSRRGRAPGTGQGQRGGPRAQLFGKGGGADVDAHPHHDPTYAPRGPVRFAEDPRELAPIDEHVIRPFEQDRGAPSSRFSVELGGAGDGTSLATASTTASPAANVTSCAELAESSGRSTKDAYRFSPGGECQTRPSLPRPLVWVSATNAAP